MYYDVNKATDVTIASKIPIAVRILYAKLRERSANFCIFRLSSES